MNHPVVKHGTGIFALKNTAHTDVDHKLPEGVGRRRRWRRRWWNDGGDRGGRHKRGCRCCVVWDFCGGRCTFEDVSEFFSLAIVSGDDIAGTGDHFACSRSGVVYKFRRSRCWDGFGNGRSGRCRHRGGGLRFCFRPVQIGQPVKNSGPQNDNQDNTGKELVGLDGWRR